MRDAVEEAFDPEFTEEKNLRGTERVNCWTPAVRRMAFEFAARMAQASMWCGSPVEEMFLAGFLASDSATNVVLLDPEGARHFLTDNPEYMERYLIQPQFQVGKFRCDFLVTMAWNDYRTSVIVEIDGHEFHEKNETTGIKRQGQGEGNCRVWSQGFAFLWKRRVQGVDLMRRGGVQFAWRPHVKG